MAGFQPALRHYGERRDMTRQSLPIETILFASARASAHFALSCLEPVGEHLRACSSFVTPRRQVMHWHDFGDLEGPGWAANAVGGAHLLYCWGRFVGDAEVQARALALLDHVLEDGFIDRETGFIWPYYDLATGCFCANYVHRNDWVCPGSLARIGVQLLEFADDLAGQTVSASWLTQHGQAGPEARVAAMAAAARNLAAWLAARVPFCENGWVPRRITLAGEPYPLTPDGRPDPIFDHSGDGLYLLQLYASLTSRGLADYRNQATALADAFVTAGGFWGSLNHDTYDDHENVAYAVAFRVLRRAAADLGQPGWRAFAYEVALPGLARFQMHEDRHGVATMGLLWMEASWNTAYLWENAEAGLAFLEAWAETGESRYRDIALSILSAIARHHHGDAGFLTEGVDWDNHVTRRHHIGEALYGDIRYTEPLLNNLHLVAPTLYYFAQVGYQAPADMDDAAAIALVRELSAQAMPPVAGAEEARYLVRLYHPALATDDRLEQALDFVRRCRADGVLLFEASYDMDPALLTPDTLRQRFARLKEVVPRFRAVVPAVHINVMITMGHVDAGCARPERFPFQFQVDEYGNLSRSSACPLDPAFLDYVTELYRMAAECLQPSSGEGSDVVWVDDDVRFWGHDVPGLTCFCPHHLAAMRERTGRPWTREELVAALRDANADPDLRKIWFDLQEEAIAGLAHVIERAVHQVAPQLRIGLMTVGTAPHATEGRHTDPLLRALLGPQGGRAGSPFRPLIRPGAGFWNDWTPAAVVDKAEDTARQISFLGADVQAVAEVENHPYTPFGKSERVLALELALDVLAGMPDLSLNLLSSMAGAGPLEPEGSDYAGFLVCQRPFLDALARERAGKVRRGIGIAASEDYARHVRLDGSSLTGWLEPRPWEAMLARAGLPVGRPDQAPHWIAGQVARALSDGELARYLQEGAVLDPIAAQVLVERGWGERLGLKGVHPVGDAANELLTDDPLNGPRAGHFLPAYNHIPPNQLYTFACDPACARVLSRWINVDGADLGPAAIALEPRAGSAQRIGLLPYAIRAPAVVLLNVAHREQWAALLSWASRCALPCQIVRGANLYPLAFVDPEDGSWLLAVANLAADDVQDATLLVSGLGHGPWRVARLTPEGLWRPAPEPVEGQLTLAVAAFSLAAWRLVRVQA